MHGKANRLLIPAILILVITLPVCARQTADDQAAGRGRFAPPATLNCNRNDLTSYNGQVIAYQRTVESIQVRIQTTWDTIESVSMQLSETQPISNSFLINGGVFTRADWSRIESSEGVLIEGMQVIAWLCLDDKTPPVLDWRPR